MPRATFIRAVVASNKKNTTTVRTEVNRERLLDWLRVKQEEHYNNDELVGLTDDVRRYDPAVKQEEHYNTRNGTITAPRRTSSCGGVKQEEHYNLRRVAHKAAPASRGRHSVKQEEHYNDLLHHALLLLLGLVWAWVKQEEHYNQRVSLSSRVSDGTIHVKQEEHYNCIGESGGASPSVCARQRVCSQTRRTLQPIGCALRTPIGKSSPSTSNKKNTTT